MPIWKVPGVDVEPVVTVVRWRVVETDAGTRHFVGYNPVAGAGRVSSAIESLDTANRSGETKSGRVYRLEGPPGLDRDALATWDGWATVNNVKRATDVTELLFPDTDTGGQ